MTRTIHLIIVALFAYGCTTAISASEKELSAREDSREVALWSLMTSDKK